MNLVNLDICLVKVEIFHPVNSTMKTKGGKIKNNVENDGE